MTDDQDDELLQEFLIESFEGLDQVDEHLLALEHDPSDRDAIAAVFRAVHTIKGTCGFLGFEQLEAISHTGENLLSLLRDGTLAIDAEIATALLQLTDALRAILVRIEHDGNEGDATYDTLVAELQRLQNQDRDQATSAPDADEAQPGDDRLGAILVSHGVVDEADIALGLVQQSEGDPRHLGEILVEQGVAEPLHVRDALDTQNEQRSNIVDSTIRVDVSLLADLMDLVGELVLARNQILQWGATQDVDATFLNTTQRLNLITSELQARMMKTRMQPIGSVWSKFPRVVRDLAAKCGKTVSVVMEGQDTELDKTLIEAIRDPLTHLVRNAVDHGVEMPDVRAAAGKPAVAVLTLRAYHEGGQVNVEIADDGAGIDVERIRAKAIAQGLVSDDDAVRLSERETLELIFRPGFSTAQQVTSVSGRGVGMDVVRTNIENIGGSIEIVNRPGLGTTFTMKIPLTLAIIPALVVSTANDRFAIPQVNLVELVRLDPDSGDRIESVQGTPVYRLRGNILPIVSLRDELALSDDASESDDATPAVNLVVLQAENRQFGLVVDHIDDTQEIVVKPLTALTEGVPVFSGCTIMGDGAVALIVDVHGLARRARVLEAHSDHHANDTDEPLSDADCADAESLLVVDFGADGRGAMALSSVHRLEDVALESIELSAGREVVQYRGGIMPLVRVADVLGVPPAGDSTGALQVVVHDDGERVVGLVVEQVVDIVTESVTLTPTPDAAGVKGSVVLGGVVTDVIDVAAIARAALAGRAPASEHMAQLEIGAKA